MGVLNTSSSRAVVAGESGVAVTCRHRALTERFCHLGLRWLLVACMVCLPDSLSAQRPREYDLKAVFLYNLASFVDWPPGVFERPESPFVIGVLGDDPFGAVLDDVVANEYVGKHPFEVRRFRRADEVAGCHVLFISDSEKRRLRDILSRLRGRPILTVADQAGFAEAGGMVGFGAREGHLHLFVNPNAVRAVRLSVSSKLLELAQIVDEFAASP
jgi:hypothetical protein